MTFFVSRHGRRGPPTLGDLSGTFTLPENATAGAQAGVVFGKRSGSTLTLPDDAGGRVAISGGNRIVRGATALNYESATSHSFTVRETLAGATGSPKDTVLSLTVTNVLEVVLNALALDDDTVTEDGAVTINITGATTGSTIAVEEGSLPAGLTLNSGARTITGTPTTPGTYPFVLRETATDATPRDTTLGITIDPAVVPVNVTPPAIVETALEVGDNPTWTNGTWTNSPTSYTAELYADGVVIPGGPYTSGSYELQAAEEGADITVGVVASNAAGDSTEEFSDPVGPVTALNLADPVIVLTSDPGTNPPEFTVDADDLEVGWYYQLDFTDDGSAPDGTADSSIEFTSAMALGGPVDWSAGPFAPGATLRWRLRYGPTASGPWSDWSNELTDDMSTLPETATEWHTVDGVNRKSFLPDATGTPPLTQGNPGGGFNGAPCSVRATQSRAGKRRWTVQLTGSFSNMIWLGVDNGGTNFNSGFPISGRDNSNGVALRLNSSSGSTAIYVGGVAVQSGLTVTAAANDYFVVEQNMDDGAISFFRVRAGVQVQIGTTVTGLAFSDMIPWIALEAAGTWTGIFGAGQPGTPTSGFVPHDN